MRIIPTLINKESAVVPIKCVSFKIRQSNIEFPVTFTTSVSWQVLKSNPVFWKYFLGKKRSVDLNTFAYLPKAFFIFLYGPIKITFWVSKLTSLQNNNLNV